MLLICRNDFEGSPLKLIVVQLNTGQLWEYQLQRDHVGNRKDFNSYDSIVSVVRDVHSMSTRTPFTSCEYLGIEKIKTW